jgi:CheY-like chemotaxis protein
MEPSTRPSLETAGRTVLVVEDDPPIRGLVSRILSHWGYLVRTAADGEEALTEIARQRPDLVLADVFMPRINGIELAERLQAEPSPIPIVLFSATSTHENLPPVPFLAKPFTLGQFFGAVTTAGLRPVEGAPSPFPSSRPAGL